MSLMNQPAIEFHGLHHVQLAMPAGEEGAARGFYSGVLGLVEIPKPAELAARGGAWFRGGALEVHLGVAADFVPAKKAHPAFLVSGLASLVERLQAAGAAVVSDVPLAGFDRVFT